jgi:hypothetical protein
VPSEPVESAREWGKRQAAEAPPWSEAKWRRICAILRIEITATSPDKVARETERRGTEAAQPHL